MTGPIITEPLHSAETARMLGDIWDERVRQDDQWGEQNHTPLEWMSILAEEIGEVAQHVNQMRWSTNGRLDMDAHNGAYRNDMLHVAAVAVAAIESLYRQWGDTP